MADKFRLLERLHNLLPPLLLLLQRLLLAYMATAAGLAFGPALGVTVGVAWRAALGGEHTHCSPVDLSAVNTAIDLSAVGTAVKC
jgi:hypothetical protein